MDAQERSRGRIEGPGVGNSCTTVPQAEAAQPHLEPAQPHSLQNRSSPVAPPCPAVWWVWEGGEGQDAQYATRI
eukprot:363951-Chlamydomonas_euryale.AAC.6